MKHILLNTTALIAMIALITSCSDKPKEEEAPVAAVEQAVPPAPATPAPVIVEEAPKIVEVAPPPVATPPPLAPEGVFFLTVSVSVESDSGIIGLRPGTRVIRQADGKFIAQGHKELIELTPNQMTNVIALAQRIIQSQQAVAVAPPAPVESSVPAAAESFDAQKQMDEARAKAAQEQQAAEASSNGSLNRGAAKVNYKAPGKTILRGTSGGGYGPSR